MFILKVLRRNIAASLWIVPGTLLDLTKHDFLKGYSAANVDRMLQFMEKDGWIYQKGETYYTYTKFAMSDEMSEYGLQPLPSKRLTAAKAIKKYNQEHGR